MKTRNVLIYLIIFSYGCNLEVLHDNIVDPDCDAVVDFDFSPTTGCEAPCEISFNGVSPGAISFTWDFGDGNTATIPNPTHTYDQKGDYSVVLTIDNGACTKSTDRVVSVLTTTFEKVIEQGAQFSLLTTNDVALANDGGYIVVGQRLVEGIGNYGFWYKTDATGELEKSHFIGCCFQINSESSSILSVEAVPGIGYAVCGSLVPPLGSVSSIFIHLLDEDGNEIWTYFDDQLDGNGSDLLHASDGGFMASGSISQGGESTGYLVKLNAAGQKEWSKHNYGFETISSVLQKSDDTYALLGYNFSGESKIIIVDNNGNEIQNFPLPSIFSSSPSELVSSQDGGYLLLSVQITSAFTTSTIQKFDGSGNLLWDNNFPNSSLEQIISTEDGDFICGSTQPANLTIMPDAYIAKLDNDGLFIWDEEIGGQDREHGLAFINTPDGGFFIAGTDESISGSDATPGEKGVYLIKTDENGMIE